VKRVKIPADAPALRQLAAKTVRDDPDPEAAGGAAGLLAIHGPASAEQALWDQFESWSEKWRDRAADLGARPSPNDPYQHERMLEFTLVNGIGRAEAWKISAADYGRLAGLCVTASCRSMVEGWQHSAN
jgi:hypothetical protein